MTDCNVKTDTTDSIPLFRIDWGRPEVLNVLDSVTRGGYWAKGPFVDQFESAICRYQGIEHALALNSGTTALEVALRALGVGEGDEVIVPSFTFIATANAVELLGAKPIFTDIERKTFGLDPDAVQNAITEDTAAILPIHCYGRACNIQGLESVASEYDIRLLFDAAEAFGTKYQDLPVGTFGDATVFSFCQNKTIATGEGGAIVTGETDIAREVKKYRSHGRVSDDYFESSDSGRYESIGSNYRMADIVAAIGVGQMDRVQDIISRRRRTALALTSKLEGIDGVEPPKEPKNGRHVYQIYSILCEDHSTRETLRSSLINANIGCKVEWDPPVHRTKYYNQTESENLPVTDDVASRVLSLPMHPNLSSEEMERVVATIRSSIEGT